MSSLLNSLLTWEAGLGLSQEHAVIVQAIICTFFVASSILTLLAFCIEEPNPEASNKQRVMVGFGFFLGVVFLASLTGLIGLF